LFKALASSTVNHPEPAPKSAIVMPSHIGNLEIKSIGFINPSINISLDFLLGIVYSIFKKYSILKQWI